MLRQIKRYAVLVATLAAVSGFLCLWAVLGYVRVCAYWKIAFG